MTAQEESAAAVAADAGNPDWWCVLCGCAGAWGDQCPGCSCECGHGAVSMRRHVAVLTAWLDAANPRTDHETACRLMKLAEETGEVVSAYLGMTGQNPRKGTCATMDDLTGELCDVVVTAMVALATLTGDAGQAEARLQDHLAQRFPRLLQLARVTELA